MSPKKSTSHSINEEKKKTVQKNSNSFTYGKKITRLINCQYLRLIYESTELIIYFIYFGIFERKFNFKNLIESQKVSLVPY